MKEHDRGLFLKWRSSVVFCLSVLFFDQVTKYLALVTLPFGTSYVVFLSSPFSFFLTPMTNLGAAWGIGALHPMFLLAVRVGILLVLLFLWRRIQKKMSYLAIALIVGGALSNMLDCFIRGAVIDFIHWRFFSYDYPVFNVADSAIFLGTLGLLFTYPEKATKRK